MKKPTRMPCALQPLARGEDLGDRRALVHGIEDALAAALGADPGLRAAGLAQRLRHRLAGDVGADLDGERHLGVVLLAAPARSA